MATIRLLEFSEQCERSLREITEKHTQGLLRQEEEMIRDYLLRVLNEKSIDLDEECSNYWSVPVEKARAYLDSQEEHLPYRSDITEEIRMLIEILTKVSLKEAQKNKLIDGLRKSIGTCITSLMQGRRKRLEERKKKRGERAEREENGEKVSPTALSSSSDIRGTDRSSFRTSSGSAGRKKTRGR